MPFCRACFTEMAVKETKNTNESIESSQQHQNVIPLKSKSITKDMTRSLVKLGELQIRKQNTIIRVISDMLLKKKHQWLEPVQSLTSKRNIYFP